ncbi:MAG TPA: hypothetical protein VF812_12205 [Ktedonobacterales bacterium]
MRVRDHVLLSTIAATALYPTLGRKALVPWAASILIDVDHYVWFCLGHRSISLTKAIRFFNEAQPPQHIATHRLHGADVLAAVAITSIWWRPMRLVFGGLIFHVALDAAHNARLSAARRLALERDHMTCQWCGARDDTIVAHVWRQPALLPSYRPDTLISLCGRCHELAHKLRPDDPIFTRARSAKAPVTNISPGKELAGEH